MANGCCSQLRHVTRVGLSCKCELKWLPRRSSRQCSSVHRSIYDMFCDGVLDMAHTHAFLQEEKEDGSIRRRLQAFITTTRTSYMIV